MSQLGLPLPRVEGGGADVFLLSDSNRDAAAHLDRWGTWALPVTILSGPRKSGRSLLARLAMTRVGGDMLDDADRRDEVSLFHAWNRAVEARRPLVIVSDCTPPEWRPALPDLRSRLAATPAVSIADPDPALVPLLIAHLFERRNLHVNDALVEWLARRVERTHLALLRAVDALDEAALARHVRLSIALARQTLGPMDHEDGCAA